MVGKFIVKKLMSNYEEYWEKELFKEGNRKKKKAGQGGNKKIQR